MGDMILVDNTKVLHRTPQKAVSQDNALYIMQMSVIEDYDYTNASWVEVTLDTDMGLIDYREVLPEARPRPSSASVAAQRAFRRALRQRQREKRERIAKEKAEQEPASDP